MQIREHQSDDIYILELEGKLDTVTSNDLHESLVAILDANAEKVIIDFKGVDYLSSTGLRVFIQAQKRLKPKNGTLALCSLKPHIKEIFDISGLTQIFTFYPTQDDAKTRLS